MSCYQGNGATRDRLAAAVALAVALGGCGGEVVSPKSVIAAMGAQPRMIVEEKGGSIRRAVIDTKRQYLALFSSGKLVLLERGGVQYREANGCYDASPTGRPRTQSLWAGTLDDITGGPHTTKRSNNRVIYKSSAGELTVDPRTDLIQSARSAGLPSGGVAAISATFQYPRSVAELPAPTDLCH